MRQEMGPTPEGLRKFDKREEALEGLEKDLEHGLSASDEEFEQKKEETIEELGGKTIEENKDKKSKRKTIH